MIAAMHLEFRKQQSTFFSSVLLLVLSAAAILLIGFLRHQSIADVFQAIAGAMLALGVPLAALSFPASAALGLRSIASRAAEEPLPLSPARKVFGAYCTNLVYFLCFALPICGIAQATHVFGFFNQFDRSTVLLLLALALLHLHFLTFAFCYWLNQSTLGSALALALVALECYFVWLLQPLLIWYYQGYPYRIGLNQHFWTFVILSIVLSGGAGIAGLRFVTHRVERERKVGLALSALTFGAFLSGMLFLFFTLQNVGATLETKLRPLADSELIRFLINPLNSHSLNGAVFETPAGSLVGVDENGRKFVLHKGSEIDPLDSRTFNNEDSVMNLFFSERENWLILQPDSSHRNIFEIERAAGGQSFVPYTTFSLPQTLYISILQKGNDVWLYGKSEEGSILSAPMPAKGKPPRWNVSAEKSDAWVALATLDERLEPLYATGRVARLSADHKQLRAQSNNAEQIWALPGKALRVFPHSDFIPATAESFIVPVVDDHQRTVHFLQCKNDGTITSPWNVSFPAWSDGAVQNYALFRSLNNGDSAWIYGGTEHYQKLLLMKSNGTTFPALDLSQVFPRAGVANPLRLRVFGFHESQILLAADHKLLRVDANSGNLSGSAMSFDSMAIASQEGIYYVAGDRIHLLRWNGTMKDLGPASL